MKTAILILATFSLLGCGATRKLMKNCKTVEADGNYFVCEKGE